LLFSKARPFLLKRNDPAYERVYILRFIRKATEKVFSSQSELAYNSMHVVILKKAGIGLYSQARKAVN
jgi:hypothetical protein